MLQANAIVIFVFNFKIYQTIILLINKQNQESTVESRGIEEANENEAKASNERSNGDYDAICG